MTNALEAIYAEATKTTTTTLHSIALIGSFVLGIFGFLSFKVFFGIFAVLIVQNYEAVGAAIATLPRDLRGLVTLRKMKVLLRRRLIENHGIPGIFDKEVVTKKAHENCFHDIESNKDYTYKQVQQMSCQVAYYFKEQGYKKDDVVAVLMTNRAEFPIIWLGLARVGIVSAWINFNLRNNALGHSIEISKAKSIIVSGELQGELVEAMNNGHIDKNAKVYVWTDKEDEHDLNKGIANAAELRPLISNAQSMPTFCDSTFKDVLCYIYTSGTTGLPKAAIIKHYRYTWMSQGVGFPFGLTPNDRLYINMPMYHTAAGILAIGNVFTYGCSAAIKRKFSASKFWDECIEYNCTGAQYIGEIARYLLAQPVKPTDKQHKVWIVFGNGLRPKFWREFCDRFNIKKVGEFYGSTEGNSSIINTDNTEGAIGFFPVYPFLRFLMPINVIKTDRETGEPVRGPDGLCMRVDRCDEGEAIGRIVEGDIMAQYEGYANNKEGTDKKIIRDVFKKGDMAFTSGDILSVDRYGYLYFKDRTGDTFRWKGENVSTMEVESVVQKCLDHERDATVFGVTIRGLEGKAGMAAIEDEKQELTEAELDKLASRMRDQLPAYARPVFLRLCEEVEKTGTHKVKKSTLVKEGFDPSMAGKSRLYYLDVKQQKYKPLTNDVYQQIEQGKIVF